MITRVRNNFFHGGKYNDLVVVDSLRNTDLLRHSLIILNECLELDNVVTNHFNNLELSIRKVNDKSIVHEFRVSRLN